MCAPEAVFSDGTQDQVDMVGHQTPRPHRNGGLRRRLGEKVPIGGVIGVRKEHPLAAVAALRDVIGDAGDHETGAAGHARGPAGGKEDVNFLHCHRNCGIVVAKC